ncbi:MAG TPA: TIGR03663 family protein [Anaerolineales bacterium]|nr:TIGR03663 family protein [Anaerolineales bacterium]HNO31093.1 TIGR03663 family protein [Anaerolineales bacterium]
MESKNNWLDRPVHTSLPAITNEILIFVLVILLAIITRFYDLGTRVMSHDESLHTYFSWLLYRGQGYEHSPMMHGPFQFHIVALTYFLFGASDFTSRIPTALFSIAIVWMVWYWRQYLGKWGALIAGILMVISPYMLYYGRYVRNESFVAFSGLLMLYAMLRHLELGGKKYLLMVAAALALHFTSKETSFIYTAQALLYLAVYFIVQVTRRPWKNAENEYRTFVIALSVSILFAGAAVVYGLYTRDASTLTGAETALPSDPNAAASPLAAPNTAIISLTSTLAVAALISLIVTAYYLIRGYTWERIRNDRSFELLMVTGTIVLPQLSPFLINMTNVTIPTTAPEIQALGSDTRGLMIIGALLLLTFILAIAAGLLWNPEKWFKTALVFWIPFTILYTTVFTNSDGFFTGTIGSLGYWLVQQGVERGSQPWYYYLLIQIPIYEFLPALGLFLAIIVGWRRKVNLTEADQVQVTEEAVLVGGEAGVPEPVLILGEEEQQPILSSDMNFVNMFSLLVWWSLLSFVAFSFAGERMPWLTVHITWPMILLTGWALGRIIDTLDWAKVREQNVALTVTTLAIFIASISRAFYLATGPIRPFQGQALEQLQATNAFLLPLIVSVLSAVAGVYLLRQWSFREFRHVFTLMFFGFLAVLTARAAFRASYITYDQATEFLVYAHGATGIKEVISQAEEISKRTTGGMGVALAYDASAPDTGVSWPFVWYLRDFTNQRSFDQPTRSLRDSVVIVVDEKNFDKIEPAIGPGYYRIDYIRMWWPMQDYFTLVSDRDSTLPFPEDYACTGVFSILKLNKGKDYTKVCEAFTNPQVRAGIIQIWLNRDYTQYAQAYGRSDLDVANWQPADKMRLYIRQDVASQIWNYGVAPITGPAQEDPTEGKYVTLSADRVYDSLQPNPVTFNAPRSMAFAKDGTLYVADSRNHRILHLDLEGNILQEWGSFADGISTPIGDGTFNEPWGIAVGPDGSVYVTDTWNHRVEKFSSTGRFIKAWGTFGQGETPESFYGPRGLALDAQGRVYVTDTGNKRIVVFDADGNFITQFGSAGFDAGQFDEPVGVALDKNGTVYVTDTWNSRIQSFTPIESDTGLTFVPDKQWDVYGWFGQSLENKPFIAVNDALHVFITDPEGYRVMEFDQEGQIVRVWGDYGNTTTGFGSASGIAVDAEGHVWVSDGVFNRVVRFTLP